MKKQEMVEVCCECYYPGVESGRLDGDVWCSLCEKHVSRSLIITKEEAHSLQISRELNNE